MKREALSCIEWQARRRHGNARESQTNISSLWLKENLDEADVPQNLEIFFEVSTECVPLQNAACANFAKEKSESPLCGAVERTEWIVALRHHQTEYAAG